MERLNLSLVPVTGGMRAGGPGQKIEDQIFVQRATGEPQYYWALDMPRPDPTKTAEQLAGMFTRQDGQDVMAPEDLHMTIRYKQTPGPDKPYDDSVARLGPQRVVFKTLYEDRHGNVVVAIGVPKETEALMRDSQVPHVSIAQGPGVPLGHRDLGHIAREGDRVTNWENDEGGWQKSGRLRRKHLGFTVVMTPRAHLEEYKQM